MSVQREEHEESQHPRGTRVMALRRKSANRNTPKTSVVSQRQTRTAVVENVMF
jgi:hypothetical protein